MREDRPEVQVQQEEEQQQQQQEEKRLVEMGRSRAVSCFHWRLLPLGAPVHTMASLLAINRLYICDWAALAVP